MAKINVEIEVPTDKYCDYEDTVCPVLCMDDNSGKCYCAIFGKYLEIDIVTGCCIRCDKCKQAEVEDESLGMVSK